MSNIRIDTLTPVHIGSGNFLQNNLEFIVTENSENELYVIDERKILDLIGAENINNWLLSIEKGEPTQALVKRYSPTSTPQDYSLRSALCFANNIKPKETLKEIMYNGLGLPYIPGSSIKGAIRTAVTASLANLVDNKEGKINAKKATSKEVEKELFGNSPNTDIFRFVRVGDAYFSSRSVIAMRMVNLNITHKESVWDTSKSQIIEAIGGEVSSHFQLHIARKYYDWASKKDSKLGKLPPEMYSLSDLFMLINTHTQQLVEDEIKYWSELDKINADIYVDSMKEILEQIKCCVKGKSCVLRIGHASGWRFITGAWTESLSNFKSKVLNDSRPNNVRYQEYDFPKTRRVDDDSELVGFVKLTIEN